jgi:oligoendopeptidase F
VAQADAYLQQIQTQLTPLYRRLNQSDYWSMDLQQSSEQQTFAYVQDMAQNMGGIIGEAFDAMAQSRLYDISYGLNKFDASFVVYLYDYQAPYVFVNPTMTEHDKLTFSHEFGHFCNYYASYGGGAGVDVAEIFSQGLEYLSLCYTEDKGNLEKIRMASCLTTYVEQAAFASFERQVYGLTGDALTVENIQALYRSVGTAYGFDSWAWDSRDYVCINHFFTSPMYIISYVVSNDVALQLYQMEQAQQGSGLACYTKNLSTQEAYFLAFVDSAGLKSPFTPDRLEEVKKTLETVLG